MGNLYYQPQMMSDAILSLFNDVLLSMHADMYVCKCACAKETAQ